MSRRPFPLGGDNAAIQTKVVVFCIVKNTKAPIKNTKSLASRLAFQSLRSGLVGDMAADEL